MKKILLTLIVAFAFCGSMFAQAPWADFNDGPYASYTFVMAFVQIDGNYVEATDNWADLEVGAYWLKADGTLEWRGYLGMDDYTEIDPYPIVDGVVCYYNTMGESINFMLYDYSTGTLYDNCSIFRMGTPDEPLEIVTGDYNYDELYFDYDEAVVLNFSSGPTISATANPLEGGTIIGAGPYDEGAVCTLSAMANPGYSFLNWTENDEVVSSDAEYTFTVDGNRNLVANFLSDNVINFADANVKALCVANWDTDGDGELSYAEAAAVTDLGYVFRYNSSITSFDELQYFINLTSIGYYAFYNCYNLTSIELPNSVTSIGYYAFYYCYNLTSIELPDSVTSIGGYAFYDCYNLTSIELPDSVTSIGGSAFYYCYNLTSVELPNSLTSIGDRAFGSCSGLISIEIPGSVTYLGSNPFAGCSGLEYIAVASDNAYYDSRENCNAIINTSTNTLVTGCKNTVIPNAVTSIGYYAFYGCNNLTSIEIPNTVTSINYGAFYNCYNLTSIEIPNTVTSIGSYAFYRCYNLTSIEIPNTVTSINYGAFYYCYNLTSIELPDSVTSIGGYAFYNCYNLTSIELPNSVTSISDEAFGYCTGLSSMTVLTETPPSMGNNVFDNVPTNIPVYVPCDALEDFQMANGWSSFNNILGLCSGEVEVMINPYEGGTVTGAGYYTGGEVCVLTATPNQGYVFANWTENGRVASMDSVYSFYAHPTTMVANFCSNSPIVFADANVKALCVANWDTDGDGELSYAEAAAVTDLGEVFMYNSSITSFDELQYFISLTSIGYDAFYECYNLTSIEIPNSVTTIGNYAFSYCYNLTSIELPNSVSLIGDGAFESCYSLTGNLIIPNSVTSIGYDAFYDCYNLTSIELPNSVTSIGDWAFGYCSGLTSIEIPGSVTYLGSNPFAGCSGLEYIAVDPDNAYYDSRENCNAIIETSTNTLVTGCYNTVIPNVVTSIGYAAFYNCSNLTSVEIPNSVISIGDNAFGDCYNLASVEIPNSVNSLGYYAFGNCSGMTSITIGNSVTSIGDYAFSGCYSLTSVEIPNSVTSIGYGAFWECSGMTSITIGNSVNSMGEYAFSGCYNLTSVEIPNSVTSIGYGAFWECSGMTSLTIGNSLASIDDYAFYYCTGLSSMTVFAETPPSMGYDVFYYVSTNIPIYVPCGASIDYQASSGWSNFTNYIEMCPSNYWTAENYQNSMFMIGVVKIDGIEQTSPVLELGAFCNGECRGTVLPEYDEGQWLYFMTIGGNNGDEITFRLYDHAIQQELNLYCFNVLPFEMYGLVGMDEPYEVLFASTLTVSADVSPENAGTITGTGEYEPGTDATLTATANEGYVFNSWTLDGEIVSIEPSYTFTVTAPVTLTANFDVLYSVLIDINIENAGTVTGEGEYLLGTSVTVTATPNEGYAFNSWTLDGEIVSTEPSYTFAVNGSVHLTANFDVVQSQQLALGWNWFSTYLEITLDDLKAALVEALPGATNIVIQSKSQSTTYNGSRWRGQLNTLDVAVMYKITVPAGCEITLTGMPIDPAEHPISIPAGQIVWIGFPFSESMTPTDAFAGFAVNGDMVSSKIQSSVYYGTKWRGQLNTLVPGQGYIYKSNAQGDRTFTFPISTK